MGLGGQRHAPAAFAPEKDPVPILQEAGWALEPVWIGASTGIRSADLPDRSESLYRLSHPGFILFYYYCYCYCYYYFTTITLFCYYYHYYVVIFPRAACGPACKTRVTFCYKHLDAHAVAES